MVSQPDITWIS